MAKRLYRSEHERMIAGVCGGLAEHLDVDPTLVRIAFLLLFLIHGIGLIVYVVMAVIVPRESKVHVLGRDAVRANAAEYGEQARRAAEKVRGAVGGASPRAATEGHEAAPPSEGTAENEAASGEPPGMAESPPPPPAGGAATPARMRRGGVLAVALIVVGVLLLLSNLGLFWWMAWSVWWPVLLILLGIILAARAMRG